MPLLNDEKRVNNGWGDVDIGRRLRLFCDVYGATPQRRADLLAAVLDRIAIAAASIEEWGQAGREPFAEFLERGIPKDLLAKREFIRSSSAELARWLA